MVVNKRNETRKFLTVTIMAKFYLAQDVANKRQRNNKQLLI